MPPKATKADQEGTISKSARYMRIFAKMVAGSMNDAQKNKTVSHYKKALVAEKQYFALIEGQELVDCTHRLERKMHYQSVPFYVENNIINSPFQANIVAPTLEELAEESKKERFCHFLQREIISDTIFQKAREIARIQKTDLKSASVQVRKEMTASVQGQLELMFLVEKNRAGVQRSTSMSITGTDYTEYLPQVNANNYLVEDYCQNFAVLKKLEISAEVIKQLTVTKDNKTSAMGHVANLSPSDKLALDNIIVKISEDKKELKK